MILNEKFAAPMWTHGIGRFIHHNEGVRYSCLLPAFLATDGDFAAWIFDLTLMTAAITLQETRPDLDGGEPVPNLELSTALVSTA